MVSYHFIVDFWLVLLMFGMDCQPIKFWEMMEKAMKKKTTCHSFFGAHQPTNPMSLPGADVVFGIPWDPLRAGYQEWHFSHHVAKAFDQQGRMDVTWLKGSTVGQLSSEELSR